MTTLRNVAHEPFTTSPRYKPSSTKSKYRSYGALLIGCCIIIATVFLAAKQHFFSTAPATHPSIIFATSPTPMRSYAQLPSIIRPFIDILPKSWLPVTPTSFSQSPLSHYLAASSSSSPTFSLHESLRDDDPTDCDNINEKPDPCAFISTNSNCPTDGYINWLGFRYCTLPHHNVNKVTATIIVGLCLAIGSLLLLTALGQTADVWLVPSLGQISTELGLSPPVAGLTFLAFGNGAPDILTTISSVQQGDLPLVVGALSGAAVCISCFVLGMSILVAPKGKAGMSKSAFFRNWGCYCLCIMPTIAFSWFGTLNVFSGIIFISLYVLTTIAQVCFLQWKRANAGSRHIILEKLQFLETLSSFHALKHDPQYQHEDLMLLLLGISQQELEKFPELRTTRDNLNTSIVLTTMGTRQHQQQSQYSQETHTPIMKLKNNNQNTLLEQDNIDVDDLEGDSNGIFLNSMSLTKNTTPTTTSAYVPPTLSFAKPTTQSQQQPQNDLDLLDERLPSISPSSTNIQDLDNAEAQLISRAVGADPGDDFLPEDSYDGMDDGDDDESDPTTYMHGLTWPDPSWEQNSAWANLWFRFLWILTFPFSLARWLTVPSTHIRPDLQKSFKRVFLHLSPLMLCLVLALSMFGLEFKDHIIGWSVVLGAGVTIIACLNIFYFCIVGPSTRKFLADRDIKRDEINASQNTSHQLDVYQLQQLLQTYFDWQLHLADDHAKPSSMRLFETIIALLGFLGSVLWLSIFADMIVNALQSLGIMFGISSTILGLTVLAIGNSIPDIIADVSLAYNGKISVSYGAIFGAPSLSNSAGFGVALVLKFIKSNGITLDITNQFRLCWISVIFVSCTHFIVYSVFKFQPPKAYGGILMIAYLIFLASAVVLEIY